MQYTLNKYHCCHNPRFVQLMQYIYFIVGVGLCWVVVRVTKTKHTAISLNHLNPIYLFIHHSTYCITTWQCSIKWLDTVWTFLFWSVCFKGTFYYLNTSLFKRKRYWIEFVFVCNTCLTRVTSKHNVYLLFNGVIVISGT